MIDNKGGKEGMATSGQGLTTKREEGVDSKARRRGQAKLSRGKGMREHRRAEEGGGRGGESHHENLASLRVLESGRDRPNEQLRSTILELESLELDRTAAIEHYAAQAEHRKQKFDEGLKDKGLKRGMLVLRYDNHFDTRKDKKFMARWEGPFLVYKKYTNGSYRLQDISGKLHKTRVNDLMGANIAAYPFVLMSLIVGVVGIAFALSGLHHLKAWCGESGALAGVSALIARLLTSLAFGVAVQEKLSPEESVNYRKEALLKLEEDRIQKDAYEEQENVRHVVDKPGPSTRTIPGHIWQRRVWSGRLRDKKQNEKGKKKVFEESSGNVSFDEEHGLPHLRIPGSKHAEKYVPPYARVEEKSAPQLRRSERRRQRHASQQTRALRISALVTAENAPFNASKKRYSAAACKAEVDGSSSMFACGGKIDATQYTLPFSIYVQGLGQLALPLSPSDITRLVGLSEQAPSGKGTATIVEKSVREVRQIDAALLTYHPQNSTFFLYIAQAIAAHAVEKLGMNPHNIRLDAKPYKLLLYEAGGYFAFHQNTEREFGMFGTLIIQITVCLHTKVIPLHQSPGTLLTSVARTEAALKSWLQSPDEKGPQKIFIPLEHRHRFCEGEDGDYDRSEFDVTKWVGENDREVNFSSIKIDLDSELLMYRGDLFHDDLEPDAEEHDDEFKRKYGSSDQYWYHIAMLAVWPNRKTMPILGHGGLEGGLDLVELKMSKGEISDAEVLFKDLLNFDGYGYSATAQEGGKGRAYCKIVKTRCVFEEMERQWHAERRELAGLQSRLQELLGTMTQEENGGQALIMDAMPDGERPSDANKRLKSDVESAAEGVSHCAVAQLMPLRQSKVCLDG
ncbi:hypothetical protein L7F22_052308 [Adiantum nelumboides]|nr:hypothetical protein [Adiantum nelumboides]